MKRAFPFLGAIVTILLFNSHAIVANGAQTTHPKKTVKKIVHPKNTATFTDAQRKEIVLIVKNILKEDPTILGDAIMSLQNNLAHNRENAALTYVRSHPDQFKNSQQDVVLGNPLGSITVTEFYDPRCPYCIHVLSDLKQLTAQEPQLKLVEKVIPVLGPRSIPDAQAILAAGHQHAYEAFQNALMNNKSKPGIERIRQAAVQAGVDPEQLQQDMQSTAVRDELTRNLELARQIGVDGTPTFVIGEKTIIPGAASFEELKTAIENVQKP